MLDDVMLFIKSPDVVTHLCVIAGLQKRKGQPMGVPAHFSLELPRRCMKLINDFLPTVGTVFADSDRRELGGLTSTFLISMAGPIVVLPIERIERHLQKNDREGNCRSTGLAPVRSTVSFTV